MNFDPNFLFYWMVYNYSVHKDTLFEALSNEMNPDGQRAIVKFFNFGGSRSSKSFDAVHFIVKMLDSHRDSPLKVNVYRSELVLARDLTLADFKLCFDIIGLVRDRDYSLTGDSSSARPRIRLWRSEIHFMGYPEKGKEAGFCDIAYINEVLEEPDRKDVYDSIKKRCSKVMILDGNPKYTDHWAFEQQEDYNAFYSQTSYLDNRHLPDGLAAERESKCPWDFKDSRIDLIDSIDGFDLPVNGFYRRTWLKPECPKNEVWSSKYRAVNKENERRGTIDRFDWLVYSEGIRTIQEGAVFSQAEWEDEFSDDGHDEVILCMDFGYTVDPTTLNRIGRSGKELTIENMVYQPTATPEICYYTIEPFLLKEVERRKKNGEDGDELWIACESQDKYGTEAFVDGLNSIAVVNGNNWNFFKVKKTSILAGVTLVKKFKLTLIDNPFMRREQQNYVHKKVFGKFINEPDPDSKFNHIWDAVRYGVSHFFYWVVK